MAIISVLVAWATLAAGPAANYEIVPGVGVGNVRLGFVTPHYRAFVESAVDKHEAEEGVAMGRRWYVWRGRTGHELDVYVVRGLYDGAAGPEDYVRIVRVTSPSFHTNAGLHVGMRFADIERQLHLTKSTGTGLGDHVFECKPRGIAFEATEGKCSAIIVFPKNAEQLPLYLPLDALPTN